MTLCAWRSTLFSTQFSKHSSFLTRWLCATQDKKWWIVDLPGYGFAKATEEEREKWDSFTKVLSTNCPLIIFGWLDGFPSEQLQWGLCFQDYFKTRTNLAGVLLLVDASIPPMVSLLRNDKAKSSFVYNFNHIYLSKNNLMSSFRQQTKNTPIGWYSTMFRSPLCSLNVIEINQGCLLSKKIRLSWRINWW